MFPLPNPAGHVPLPNSAAAFGVFVIRRVDIAGKLTVRRTEIRQTDIVGELT